MRIRYFLLLFLSSVLIMGFSAPETALASAGSDMEVIVPAEGSTELDLKSGVAIYRGQPGRPVRVLVSSPSLQMTAVTIIYDREKQLLTAHQQVELVMEEDGLQVTGEELELTEETVQVRGGFTLFYEDLRLNGDQLDGDLQEGIFTARGGLSFKHPEGTGEAERIEYEQKKGLITLFGSPHLRWADGWLQGTEETVIIYNLTTGKARAEGPTKMRVSQETAVNSDGN